MKQGQAQHRALCFDACRPGAPPDFPPGGRLPSKSPFSELAALRYTEDSRKRRSSSKSSRRLREKSLLHSLRDTKSPVLPLRFFARTSDAQEAAASVPSFVRPMPQATARTSIPPYTLDLPLRFPPPINNNDRIQAPQPADHSTVRPPDRIASSRQPRADHISFADSLPPSISRSQPTPPQLSTAPWANQAPAATTLPDGNAFRLPESEIIQIARGGDSPLNSRTPSTLRTMRDVAVGDCTTEDTVRPPQAVTKREEMLPQHEPKKEMKGARPPILRVEVPDVRASETQEAPKSDHRTPLIVTESVQEASLASLLSETVSAARSATLGEKCDWSESKQLNAAEAAGAINALGMTKLPSLVGKGTDKTFQSDSNSRQAEGSHHTSSAADRSQKDRRDRIASSQIPSSNSYRVSETEAAAPEISSGFHRVPEAGSSAPATSAAPLLGSQHSMSSSNFTPEVKGLINNSHKSYSWTEGVPPAASSVSNRQPPPTLSRPDWAPSPQTINNYVTSPRTSIRPVRASKSEHSQSFGSALSARVVRRPSLSSSASSESDHHSGVKRALNFSEDGSKACANARDVRTHTQIVDTHEESQLTRPAWAPEPFSHSGAVAWSSLRRPRSLEPWISDPPKSGGPLVTDRMPLQVDWGSERLRARCDTRSFQPNSFAMPPRPKLSPLLAPSQLNPLEAQVLEQRPARPRPMGWKTAEMRALESRASEVIATEMRAVESRALESRPGAPGILHSRHLPVRPSPPRPSSIPPPAVVPGFHHALQPVPRLQPPLSQPQSSPRPQQPHTQRPAPTQSMLEQGVNINMSHPIIEACPFPRREVPRRRYSREDLRPFDLSSRPAPLTHMLQRPPKPSNLTQRDIRPAQLFEPNWSLAQPLPQRVTPPQSLQRDAPTAYIYPDVPSPSQPPREESSQVHMARIAVPVGFQLHAPTQRHHTPLHLSSNEPPMFQRLGRNFPAAETTQECSTPAVVSHRDPPPPPPTCHLTLAPQRTAAASESRLPRTMLLGSSVTSGHVSPTSPSGFSPEQFQRAWPPSGPTQPSHVRSHSLDAAPNCRPLYDSEIAALIGERLSLILPSHSPPPRLESEQAANTSTTPPNEYEAGPGSMPCITPPARGTSDTRNFMLTPPMSDRAFYDSPTDMNDECPNMLQSDRHESDLEADYDEAVRTAAKLLSPSANRPSALGACEAAVHTRVLSSPIPVERLRESLEETYSVAGADDPMRTHTSPSSEPAYLRCLTAHSPLLSRTANRFADHTKSRRRPRPCLVPTMVKKKGRSRSASPKRSAGLVEIEAAVMRAEAERKVELEALLARAVKEHLLDPATCSQCPFCLRSSYQKLETNSTPASSRAGSHRSKFEMAVQTQSAVAEPETPCTSAATTSPPVSAERQTRNVTPSTSEESAQIYEVADVLVPRSPVSRKPSGQSIVPPLKLDSMVTTHPEYQVDSARNKPPDLGHAPSLDSLGNTFRVALEGDVHRRASQASVSSAVLCGSSQNVTPRLSVRGLARPVGPSISFEASSSSRIAHSDTSESGDDSVDVPEKAFVPHANEAQPAEEAVTEEIGLTADVSEHTRVVPGSAIDFVSGATSCEEDEPPSTVVFSETKHETENEGSKTEDEKPGEDLSQLKDPVQLCQETEIAAAGDVNEEIPRCGTDDTAHLSTGEGGALPSFSLGNEGSIAPTKDEHNDSDETTTVEPESVCVAGKIEKFQKEPEDDEHSEVSEPLLIPALLLERNSRTKLVAPGHVILLDADDTLIPTSEFCEEKYLDLELHELPEKFRNSLMALDVQLTKLFDELHSMVVFENMAHHTRPDGRNFLLSVVIVTNATLSHIQTTFEKFLPTLSAFFETRGVKTSELVCSARDLWCDEFPFEHFYDFWKAWTVEEILRELHADGIDSATVFSIGDDEPERKATAYVETELRDLVKGTKILKMLPQPKIEALMSQLEWITAQIRPMVDYDSSFDIKLEVEPKGQKDGVKSYRVKQVAQLEPPEIPDKIEALFTQFELKYAILCRVFRVMTRANLLAFASALRVLQARQAAEIEAFVDECNLFMKTYSTQVGSRVKVTTPAFASMLERFPTTLEKSGQQSVDNGRRTGSEVYPLSPENSPRGVEDPATILNALQNAVKFLLQYPNLIATLPDIEGVPSTPETPFILTAVHVFMSALAVEAEALTALATEQDSGE